MYQSVRQKGTPILRPTPSSRGPTPPLKTLLPRHGGRIMNPQDPAVLNDPNHIQNPRRGLPLNHQSVHTQQRPQISNQRPQVSLQQPVHHGQLHPQSQPCLYSHLFSLSSIHPHLTQSAGWRIFVNIISRFFSSL